MLNTSIPLSGMQAATVRLTASASNIANMNSDGALPAAGQAFASSQPYQPIRVQQTSTANGGTAATAVKADPSFVAKYDPSASYANNQGEVATPNVDVSNEVLNISTASADFTVNVKVANAVNRMVKQLFDLGTDNTSGS